MSKITVLDIHFEHEGVEASFHPVLISSKKDLILVDTAFEGFLPLIEEAIADAGEDISRLTTLILTSSELDHIGAVPELLEKYPTVKVLASEQERRYLEKEKLPKTVAALMLRTGQREDQFEEPIASYVKMLKDLPAIPVAEIVKSRDFKHIGGGIEFIAESNQTMLFCDEDGLLVAGDVFKIDENGELQLGDIGYGLSLKDLVTVLSYLESFQIAAISCFHGGIYTDEPKERISNILTQLTEVAVTIQTQQDDPDGIYLDMSVLPMENINVNLSQVEEINIIEEKKEE